MLYQILAFVFRTFFRMFYSLEITGVENRPKNCSIIAPNHASFLDPPLVSISTPTPLHFFARKSLFKNKICSYFLEKLNAHPVGSGAEGMRALAEARKLLKDDQIVVLFPEGTRSEDGELLPLRKGVVSLALKSMAPIIPLYIHGAYGIWPRGCKLPRLGGKVTMTYGEALDPQNYKHLPSPEAATEMLLDLQKRLQSMEINSNKN